MTTLALITHKQIVLVKLATKISYTYMVLTKSSAAHDQDPTTNSMCRKKTEIHNNKCMCVHVHVCAKYSISVLRHRLCMHKVQSLHNPCMLLKNSNNGLKGIMKFPKINQKLFLHHKTVSEVKRYSRALKHKQRELGI